MYPPSLIAILAKYTKLKIIDYDIISNPLLLCENCFGAGPPVFRINICLLCFLEIFLR